MESLQNRKNYLGVIFVVLIVVLIQVLFVNMIRHKWVPNPDINQNIIFSDNLAANGSLPIESSLNKEFSDFQIFGPRGVVVRDGNLYPTSMIGYIYELGVFKTLGAYLIYFSNPFFCAIVLFYVYRLALILVGDKKYALLAMFFFALNPAFIFVSSMPYNNMLALVFFFAAAYYAVSFLKSAHSESLNPSHFWLFLIFSIISFWVRYSIAVFLFPILALTLFNKRIRNYVFKIEKGSIGIFIGFVFLIFIAANFVIYDNFLGFLRPGNVLNAYEHFSAPLKELSLPERIVKFNPVLFFSNLQNQVIAVSPIICLFAFLNIFLLKRRGGALKIALFFIVFMQFAFYLGREWSGVSFVGSVGTSYARYLLPSWGILSIMAADFLYIFLESKTTLFLIVTSFLALSVNTALNSNMAYVYFNNSVAWSYNLQSQIEINTPEDSIFFVTVSDKYFYPLRETAIYTTIPEEERLDKTVWVINALLDRKISIYFIDEDKTGIEKAKIFSYFEENGLSANYSFGGNVYEIQKQIN